MSKFYKKMSTEFQREFLILQTEKIELFGGFLDQETKIKILELQFNPTEDLNFILNELSNAIEKEAYIDTYNILWLLRGFLENHKILNQNHLELLNASMQAILSGNGSDHTKMNAMEVIYATRLEDIEYFMSYLNRAKAERWNHNWWYVFIQIFWEYESYDELISAFRLAYENTIFSFSLHKDFNKYFLKIPQNSILRIMEEVLREIKGNNNGIVHKTYIDAVLGISWDSARLFLDRIKDSPSYYDICFNIINEIFQKFRNPGRPYDWFDTLLKEGELVEYILSDLQTSEINYFTKILSTIDSADFSVEENERFQVMLTYDNDLQLILAKLLKPEEIALFCENERKKSNWRIDFNLYEYIIYRYKKEFPSKQAILSEFEVHLEDEIKNIQKTRIVYQTKQEKEKVKRETEKRKEIAFGFKHLIGYNNFYPLIYKFHTEKELFNEKQTLVLKSKILEFLTDKILDPRKAELIFESREINGSSRYTSDWYVHHEFETTLIVAQKLWIDITKFKNKIFSYIPFSYSEWLTIIDELIKNWSILTDNIIQYLFSVYDWKRSDGLRYHMTSNFSHLLEKHGHFFIKKRYKERLREIVKSIILDEEISRYVREDLLKLIYKSQNKRGKKIILVYPQDIYDIYNSLNQKVNTEDVIFDNSLIDLCNQIMIKHFQDPDAVKWRLSKITILHWLEMNFDHPDLIVYSPSELESEVTGERYFIDPFSYLKDKRFIDSFLVLLWDSFKRKNRYYYDYIQDACTRYFMSIGNRSIHKRIVELINNLKSVSTENFEYKYLQKIREKYKITLKEDLASEALAWKEKFHSMVNSNSGLIDKIGNLSNEIISLKNYISQNSMDITLYVEGKTDYKILQSARKILEFQGKIENFPLRIIWSGWVSRVLKELHLDSIECFNSDISIWLFDFDREGYLAIKDPHSKCSDLQNDNWWILPNQNAMFAKKHKELNLYLISILFFELHKDIRYQVHANISTSSILSDPMHLEEYSQLTIEHLFYWKKINNSYLDIHYKIENSPIFRKIDLWNWWSFIEIGWENLKKHFATLIEREWENILANNDSENTLFDNLIPIFKFIADKISERGS